MSENVVPMIHVPDVRATVDWYQDIGFTVIDTFSDDGEGLSWAMLSFGSSQVMFNEGGRPSTERRREVDLYVYVDDVDELFPRLMDRVEVIEGLHDTFYGMREFIIRDLNRFWITFGQPGIFETLMTGVSEGNIKTVRAALERSGLKPKMLSAALLAASTGETNNVEIAEMLKYAGAVLPPEVDARILQNYVGTYKSEQGAEVKVLVKEGRLFAMPGGQHPLSLIAVDETAFTPAAFDGVTVTFNVEAGKTLGFQLKQGSITVEHKRVEGT